MTSSIPRLAFPEKFDAQQITQYPTDVNKISLVCSLLSGKALDCATAVWIHAGFEGKTYLEFERKFKEVFEYPEGGKSAGELLLSQQQGNNTISENALSFHTL